MKKLTWLFVLMVVCGALYAQTSKEIFNATLVPNAPIVIYADGSGLADNEFVKLAKKYGTDNSSSYINGVLSNFVKSI